MKTFNVKLKINGTDATKKAIEKFMLETLATTFLENQKDAYDLSVEECEVTTDEVHQVG